MLCKDLVVLEKGRIELSSLSETLKFFSSDKDGQSLSLLPGYGLVFLQKKVGVEVLVVAERRSK